nr:hypothetical protein [Tanacetum cinerariifolium]
MNQPPLLMVGKRSAVTAFRHDLLTSVTSYGPFHLGPNFLVSSAWLASLLRYTRSTSSILSVGIPISTGTTTSVSDNLSWESEPTYNVVPHKFFDLIASDGCNWFCFNPLCEVVNSYYQEFDSQVLSKKVRLCQFSIRETAMETRLELVAMDFVEHVYELDSLGTLLSVFLRPYAW